MMFFFFFQAEDGIRDLIVTGVQTCALPISILSTGAVERIGDPGARLSLRKGADAEIERTVDVPDGRAAIETALAALDPHELPAPDAVGHRVVHGGPLHRAPVQVDARLLEALNGLFPF